MEQCLETVLAIESGRDIRSLFRCAGGHEWHGASRADAQLYRGACPCFGSRRKRGQNNQALGRSRDGFSTKIHLKVDLGGLPLAFRGEASDSRNWFEILLDLGPDIAPRAAITDKGYDAKTNRDGARRRGICPVIPFKSNAILHKAPARIEQRSTSSSVSNALHYDARKPRKTTAPSSLSHSASSWSKPSARPRAWASHQPGRRRKSLMFPCSRRTCYRRRKSAQRWRRKQRRGGQPSTSVAEYGWVASPVKAGLRPPPPAADGLDTACHPAIICHQAFDCKERLRCTQGPCQIFSLRHLCADSDNHPQHLSLGPF